MVLESDGSHNRRDPIGIVGIVVVQRTTITRVADSHIVGVGSVRSAKPYNPQGGVTNSDFPTLVLDKIDILFG